MTTALVLSGGGSLGAVQVGMLRALADAGVVPDCLVGTSVGALNGAFLAGRAWPDGIDQVDALWCSLRRPDVFPTSPLLLALAAAGRSNHLVPDRGLRQLLARHLPYELLQDAAVPVVVVATEIATGREVVLRHGPAADAVLASASLPGILPPVTIDGHALIDGGLVDNTPISVAAELGVDSIIVVPTGYACALPTVPRGALAMALHAVTLSIQRRLIDEVERLQPTLDLRVVPPLCPVSVSPADFGQARQLIDRAHRQTAAWLARPRREDQAAELGLHVHGPVPAPRPHPAGSRLPASGPDH
ncbi:MAG: patatin-like phospholipase family protein [Actinobacteria bacterium]|nr:patatin-like phospholipase family protein [Actinomycetota bacterium]